MLQESKVFSFLDQDENFAIHFLEGQRLIKDLVLIHGLQQKSLNFFRDAVLSFQPMISFLKPNEGFGLYIDSKDPYFRLKLETNINGYTRSLMIPEDFNENPEKLTGVARLSKVYQDGKLPYTTILELNQSSVSDLSNIILKNSYQLDAKVIVSEECDNSLLLVRLPRPNVDKEEIEEPISTSEYFLKYKNHFLKILNTVDQNEDQIKSSFEKVSKIFHLKSTEVKFKCGCSRERLLVSVKNMAQSEELFEEGKEEVEVRCDYCKTNYLIKKDEL